MKIIHEFKEFIAKGNAFDLAVGVIIGGAFAPVVNSMVKDIIMPFLSLGVGKASFENLYLPLTPDGIEAVKTALDAKTALPTLADMGKWGYPVLGYGLFINTIISFLFLMLGVFVLMKIVNAVRKPASAPAPDSTPPPDIALLTEIRDLLKTVGIGTIPSFRHPDSARAGEGTTGRCL
jgi:large conductance mechanosensitive channel